MPALAIRDASLSFGDRTLWSHLTLDVEPGEFIAVLGANGSGKTSLLRVILGQQRLSSGTVAITGGIGYVPQQRRIDTLTPLRARDLVGLGLTGHRWGINLPGGGRRRRVDAMLEKVGATDFADRPVGLLSGGEQQRVRIAQALIAGPDLLICDEPLLSLDQRSQHATTALVDQRRRAEGTAVLFVTHEINPVLPYVDRALYLSEGRFRTGSMEEALASRTVDGAA
ncbi:ATP-binding cassette domain-containing protein [Actinoplanes sp. NPDC051851]|uniref:metal ABC transporter ATP-binding protein n=1 Tax=Actinoplanes sp. NPDC051851 TaxID=3154753 RepID=UPI00341C837D